MVLYSVDLTLVQLHESFAMLWLAFNLLCHSGTQPIISKWLAVYLLLCHSGTLPIIENEWLFFYMAYKLYSFDPNLPMWFIQMEAITSEKQHCMQHQSAALKHKIAIIFVLCNSYLSVICFVGYVSIFFLPCDLCYPLAQRGGMLGLCNRQHVVPSPETATRCVKAPPPPIKEVGGRW